MTREGIRRLFTALERAMPEPKTELDYGNPFTLLVSVVLSAQATDRSVNEATPALFALADTPAGMVALGEDGVREKIRTIGLFNTKAKNVVALSQRLLDEHGGEVPASREALQKLPGVGRKTASVVVNEVFGQAAIAVDTHVFRVANRTGLAPGPTPEKVEKRLEEEVPARWKKGAHHWLILHGRHTCLARKPRCWECVIADCCAHAPKTPPPDAARAGRLPPPAPPAPRRRPGRSRARPR